jgi:predicted Rossmann-fold nucleotide-binding protein
MLRRQFVRHNLPLPPREYGGKLDDEGLYRVAVFNSASTKNNELKDPEYAFSFGLAQNGFALVNGGGSQGSMLETQKGYAAGRNFNAGTAQGAELIKTSSAAYQSYDTRKIEGMCRLPDFWSVEPTRGLRIDRLMDVNAIIAGAGGIGTVEEIVEEAENILLGGPTRPCVLVNMPIQSGCKTVKCHDPVLELLPSSVVSQMQIVDTHDEAMEIIKKDRQDRGMDVQMIPNPKIHSFPDRKIA